MSNVLVSNNNNNNNNKRVTGSPVFGAVKKELCSSCEKTVFLTEKLSIDGHIYHSTCFKCTHCKRQLTSGNYAMLESTPYCKPHLIELFKRKGKYDFATKGKEEGQHISSTFPTSKTAVDKDGSNSHKVTTKLDVQLTIDGTEQSKVNSTNTYSNKLNVSLGKTTSSTTTPIVTTTTTTTTSEPLSNVGNSHNSNASKGQQPTRSTQTVSLGSCGGGSGMSKRIEEYQKKTSSSSSSENVGTFMTPLPKTPISSPVFGAVKKELCSSCEKTVFLTEKLSIDGHIYHSTCFKCTHCRRQLTSGNYAMLESTPYCKPHLIELFKRKGKYDFVSSSTASSISSGAGMNGKTSLNNNNNTNSSSSSKTGGNSLVSKSVSPVVASEVNHNNNNDNNNNKKWIKNNNSEGKPLVVNPLLTAVDPNHDLVIEAQRQQQHQQKESLVNEDHDGNKNKSVNNNNNKTSNSSTTFLVSSTDSTVDVDLLSSEKQEILSNNNMNNYVGETLEHTDDTLLLALDHNETNDGGVSGKDNNNNHDNTSTNTAATTTTTTTTSTTTTTTTTVEDQPSTTSVDVAVAQQPPISDAQQQNNTEIDINNNNNNNIDDNQNNNNNENLNNNNNNDNADVVVTADNVAGDDDGVIIEDIVAEEDTPSSTMGSNINTIDRDVVVDTNLAASSDVHVDQDLPDGITKGLGAEIEDEPIDETIFDGESHILPLMTDKDIAKLTTIKEQFLARKISELEYQNKREKLFDKYINN